MIKQTIVNKLEHAGRDKGRTCESGKQDTSQCRSQRCADAARRSPLVAPAAAARASGSTTAAVYDWRVGTSIWEIANRMSRTTIAQTSVGMKGTRMSRILDGTWVNTIVLIRPMRRARAAAANP